jgi:hypothetical protein
MRSLSPPVFDKDPAETGMPAGRTFNYRTLSAALRMTAPSYSWHRCR